MALLDRETFMAGAVAVPLVAVDLVFVRNSGEVLLGQRKKPPAQGFWFVPGGRLFKNERLKDAIARITDFELKLRDLTRHRDFQAQALGCFEHFYDDCFTSSGHPSSHLISLGFKIQVPDDCPLSESGVTDAHQPFRWWSLENALRHENVHHHTKDYLKLLQGI